MEIGQKPDVVWGKKRMREYTPFMDVPIPPILNGVIPIIAIIGGINTSIKTVSFILAVPRF